MTRALITDHLFRASGMSVRQGYGPCSRIDPGNCCWLGTCNRPAALAGHVWVRVGVHPRRPSTVRPARYYAHTRQRPEVTA